MDDQDRRQDDVEQESDGFADDRGHGSPRGSESDISDNSTLPAPLPPTLSAPELAHQIARGEEINHDVQLDSSGNFALVAEVTPATTRELDETSRKQAKRIGRYVVQRILGHGGFGIVHLALDPQLGRQVALKVPRRDRFTTREELDKFLVEARTAAQLKHPMLVAIYDVQQLGDVPIIVQEYVESQSLLDWCAQVRPSFEKIARIMTQVAGAVGYIHQQGLIHCDLKSANILMDRVGQPHIADFGLAMRESDFQQREGQPFGTPYTMAPEQVRGETHLLDGRTDIWAIGVMLYQMLTGRVPFAASTHDELFDVIRTHDPKPPRQIDRRIPRELERICLKCLSQRRADRYNTADDLQGDLQNWLSQDHSGLFDRPESSSEDGSSVSSQSSVPPSIVPKGLRAYDAEDANFFLALLPGPRDRDGLPESVRFWRNRIEQRDPDKTFRVGLIYGPSGSGKSSLVKAGLLPRLSHDVLPVYIEATRDDTEARLLLRIRNQVPSLPAGASLAETCGELRKRRTADDPKILLVIDQFEQWLHAHPHPKSSPLVDALRQCDGGALQAILMVRDDFFLSVNRVFQELEIRLLEGANCSMVDFFDLEHARKVLASLGRAYGRLGESLTGLQEKFLSLAIDDLVEDNKVICVQLALFADMMKTRPWVPANLEHLGGVKGVGAAMLEETFNPQTAPISYRVHDAAIRRVLKSMLPGAGADIRGAMRSVEDLQEISGYADKPREFAELIAILDGERRLITPADTAGIAADAEDPETPRYYQLTHDYLIPSLRTWLTRKQSERMRGRAELRLADIAAEWGVKPDNKRLPTTWEFANIRLLTASPGWNSNERKLMQAASQFHGRRWAARLFVLTLLGLFAWFLYSEQRDRIIGERIEHQKTQAGLLVNAALDAPADAVPYAARNITPLREYALLDLRRRFDNVQADPALRFRAATLLTLFGEPQVEFLIDNIELADRHECTNLVTALSPYRDTVYPLLDQAAEQAESQENWPLKARIAILLWNLGQTSTAQEMLRLSANPIERVTLIDTIPQWHGSVNGLLARISVADAGATRSGLLLGIGSIPLDELRPADLAAASQKVAQWYHDMPDAGTHSAADWTLRQWQHSLPELLGPHNFSSDWDVNSIGLTMLKVPPSRDMREPVPLVRGVVARPDTQLLIGDREISRKMFQQFIDDPQYDDDAKPANWSGADASRSPSPEHPVQNVSWEDAVLFCNWLSRREKRTPCYTKTGDTWEVDPSANGYRLPTNEEWELACRAGTTTEYFTGNDERYLDGYAVFRTNQTGVCGSKMPNPWGVFDVHGNVYEWCEDEYFDDVEQQAHPGQRTVRSGAFDYSASLTRSANKQANRTDRRSYTVGFRVVRNAD